jgi:hypothetical protein
MIFPPVRVDNVNNNIHYILDILNILYIVVYTRIYKHGFDSQNPDEVQVSNTAHKNPNQKN